MVVAVGDVEAGEQPVLDDDTDTPAAYPLESAFDRIVQTFFTENYHYVHPVLVTNQLELDRRNLTAEQILAIATSNVNTMLSQRLGQLYEGIAIAASWRYDPVFFHSTFTLEKQQRNCCGFHALHAILGVQFIPVQFGSFVVIGILTEFVVDSNTISILQLPSIRNPKFGNLITTKIYDFTDPS